MIGMVPKLMNHNLTTLYSTDVVFYFHSNFWIDIDSLLSLLRSVLHHEAFSSADGSLPLLAYSPGIPYPATTHCPLERHTPLHPRSSCRAFFPHRYHLKHHFSSHVRNHIVLDGVSSLFPAVGHFLIFLILRTIHPPLCAIHDKF